MTPFPSSTEEIQANLNGDGKHLRQELVEYFSEYDKITPVTHKWLKEDISSLKDLTLNDIRRLTNYLIDSGTLRRDRRSSIIYYTGKNLE